MFNRAREKNGLGYAAEAILALVQGQDSDEAEVGALLVAEALWIFRTMNTKKE